jgi:hypothetical protein
MVIKAIKAWFERGLRGGDRGAVMARRHPEVWHGGDTAGVSQRGIEDGADKRAHASARE